jgi:hypothetical protein
MALGGTRKKGVVFREELNPSWDWMVSIAIEGLYVT